MARVRGQGQRMTPESVDYKAVRADLQRRKAEVIAQFDVAIAAIEQIIGIHAVGQLSLPTISLRPASVGSKGPYANASMIEAAIQHLRQVGQHQHHQKIGEALTAGGYRHKSKNFNNTLNSVMWRRARNVGDVRKTKQGWGLTEWKQQQGVSLRTKDAVADSNHETGA